MCSSDTCLYCTGSQTKNYIWFPRKATALVFLHLEFSMLRGVTNLHLNYSALVIILKHSFCLYDLV